MLNPSDLQPGQRAGIAEIAQHLRGRRVFGAVAFSESSAVAPEQVRFDPGYADCLPILGGGCWRDPSSPATMETMQ